MTSSFPVVPRFLSVALLWGILLSAAQGCAEQSDTAAATATRRSERSRSGDTTIVRNFGVGDPKNRIDLSWESAIGKTDGQPPEMFSLVVDIVPLRDGSILVFDGSARELRLFDKEGKFRNTVGRAGGGPGEFKAPVPAQAEAPNGDVLLWDPPSTRVNRYKRDGTFITSWPTPKGEASFVRGGHVDPDGFAYSRVLISQSRKVDPTSSAGQSQRIQAAIRTDLDGVVQDTTVWPDAIVIQKTQSVKVVEGTATSTLQWPIPLEPASLVAFSGLGYYLSGDPGAYRIILHRRKDGPLLITGDRKPVEASELERQDLLAEMAHEMRVMNAQPSITVDAIPRIKPLFKSLRVDHDGRIWATLSLAGKREERVGAAAEPTVTHEAGAIHPPKYHWVEPVAYDVFAPTGEYLGTATLPEGATFGAARGDKLWLLVRNEFDVPAVVRYQLTFPQ